MAAWMMLRVSLWPIPIDFEWNECGVNVMVKVGEAHASVVLARGGGERRSRLAQVADVGKGVESWLPTRLTFSVSPRCKAWPND
jgi:hypothetical protein